MLLSARAAFRVSVLAILAFAPPVQAQGQANGIASPIQKVTPTGAVTIPQAEVPSVGTLDPVELLLHPVRLRIVHALSGGRTVTTAELCARLNRA